MLGGRKNEALYFIGYRGKQLLHLDPHYTQESVSLDAKGE